MTNGKSYGTLPVPTYNGLRLPGYDTARPVRPDEPRWMIVWDRSGWTKPVRRIVISFNGKFLDTDGNYWDFGSDIPLEYRRKELEGYWEIPDNLLDPITAWWKKIPGLGW